MLTLKPAGLLKSCAPMLGDISSGPSWAWHDIDAAVIKQANCCEIPKEHRRAMQTPQTLPTAC